MFVYLVSVAIVSTYVTADDSVTSPITCAGYPNAIFPCLGNPRLIRTVKSTRNCAGTVSECDRMTCIFNASGWLKDGKIDKQKIIEYYDQFAKDYPAWLTAVQHAKPACLSSDLPAQGTYINCPAYDVMLCTLRNFVQNALPSQWSTAERCQYPKQFAASCPMCPTDCFSAFVPYGSCTSCLILPHNP